MGARPKHEGGRAKERKRRPDRSVTPVLMWSCDAASAGETDRKLDIRGLGAVADSLLRVTADCLIRTTTQTQRGWVGGPLMLPLRDNQRQLPPFPPLLILLAVVCSLGRAW